MARQTEQPPSDASVVPSFDDFEWSDDEWMERRGDTLTGSAPMRVYEVHLGSWRRAVGSSPQRLWTQQFPQPPVGPLGKEVEVEFTDELIVRRHDRPP